jgi:hypothetical protein
MAVVPDHHYVRIALPQGAIERRRLAAIALLSTCHAATPPDGEKTDTDSQTQENGGRGFRD